MTEEEVRLSLLKPRPEDKLYGEIRMQKGLVEVRRKSRQDSGLMVDVKIRDLNNAEGEPAVNRPKPAVEIKAVWSF